MRLSSGPLAQLDPFTNKVVLKSVCYASFLQQSDILTYFFISQIIVKINLKSIVRYIYNL